MNYKTTDIKDSVNRVNNYIKQNKKNPNWIRVANDKLSINEYTQLTEIKDAINRINNWIKINNTYPTYVNILETKMNKTEYSILFKGKITKSTTSTTDKTTEHFFKTFGTCQTIDEALTKVKDKGYGHYYNDKYTNIEVINNINKGINPPNCTDSCQLFWHIAKSLNYDVECLHIQCKAGEGHVRLKLRHKKHTQGNWIYRDPAAVLSKNRQPVNYNWCMDGRVLATNPQWFMNDINK